MTDWLRDLPEPPVLGDVLSKPQLRPETLHYLAERRSLTVAQMQGPGPSDDEIRTLLRMAARVPDHRRVHPFRFIVIAGEARETLGAVLADAYAGSHPDAGPTELALERARFQRAPTTIAVISSVNRDHKTPEWEQVLTSGAVAQNLVIAAGAAGYAAQWLTEWYAFDEAVLSALGLQDHERIAGFVYLGTAAEAPKERARIDASELTSYWTGSHPQD